MRFACKNCQWVQAFSLLVAVSQGLIQLRNDTIAESVMAEQFFDARQVSSFFQQMQAEQFDRRCAPIQNSKFE
jgi:hypothetical protein